MIDYESRKVEIGKRIKRERETAGLGKKELLAKIYMSESSHKTLSAWESGERIPDLESLTRMADLFDCDIGYLLCDYNERTRDIADASQVTGLSPGAIEQLITGDVRIVEFISFLIESNKIVPVGFKACCCVDLLLEIMHYQNDVLPKLPKCDMNKTLKTFEVSGDDFEKEAKRTAVIDEIGRLSDLYEAGLWRCEKNMNTAIETFIDEEVKKYGKHSRAPG